MEVSVVSDAHRIGTGGAQRSETAPQFSSCCRTHFASA
jgi:hypothetical protein